MNDKNSFRIEKFGLHECSDELLEKFIQFTEESFLEDFPSYPPPNRDLRRKELRSKNPFRIENRWIVFDASEEIIGYAYCAYDKKTAPEYETNKHVAYVNPIVRKENRRQGIGTKLFQILINDAKMHNRSVLHFWGSNPSGKIACERWGAKLVHKHYVNRLFMKDIDWNLMDVWVNNVTKTAPEVSFELIHNVPEIDIEQFVDLYTETINQGPWGGDTEDRVTVESRRIQENLYREKGFTWITLCSREPSDELSGLTEIIYKPEEPDFMQQELTGVREKYRNRGIGKALKAKMALFIRDTYPNVEYMTTGNALENEAMLSINSRMGYHETNIFHLYRYDLSKQQSSQEDRM